MRSTTLSTESSKKIFSYPSAFEKQAKFLILGWGVLIALCLLVQGGSVLVSIFPLSSVILGLFLYFRTPILYVNFTWWMIFLGPLVRKIVDYQSGYVTFGRWGLPAILVASISLITFFRCLPRAHTNGSLPFVISFAGLLYSFLIGAVQNQLSLRYVLGFVEWLVPLAFGFHLFMQWRQYPDYQRTIQRTFIWGSVVMGSYGIYQYCVAPAWDAFYLNQLGVSSFGNPEPFGIRVWGTSTSPQEFSVLMLAATVLVLSGHGLLRYVGASTSYLALLLTMSRSGWLGWCVSALLYFPSLSQRLQIRLVVTILIMSLMILPLTQLAPFEDEISSRIESFSNIENDTSLNDRREGYDILLGEAVKQVVGRGLGSSIGNTSLGGGDSSILPLLFKFGWLGTIPYIGGILFIFLKVFQSKFLAYDPFGSAARAISLGIFSQIGFNLIFFNIFAFVLWGFLGMSLAASKYYQACSENLISLPSYYQNNS